MPPLVIVLAIAVAAPFLWVMLVDDPLGGEPVAVVAIDDPKAKDPPLPPAMASKTAAADKSNAQTVTIIDGKSGSRTQVAVQASEAAEEPVGTAPPLDARLSEASRHGSIPRVGSDGTRPLDVYSRADASAAARKSPQIAIVVGGLGIGASATGEAIARLPASVTLAFAPYGADLNRWVTRARGTGHEILLQVPMEPFDYPDNDPGPQTLLSTLPATQNIDRLHWFLSRFQGYVGVTNFMGARFTSNDTAFAPVLSDIAARGLLYFDDGASTRSLAPKVAAAAKAPFLKADLVVDAKANWSDIDAALEQLERLAADRGYAVGMATALPVSIERIARWAKAAETRGVRIVPLSAVATRSKPS
ncbi:MAG: divergent polysaccharide deacetylase family protein [Xanthobacteraceae bacterium]